MMMKKFVYILPLMATLFFTTACEDEDYRDPSTIVGDYMNEFHSILTSSELGWRFDYFPNEEAYGAFTFMMNFRKDGRVEMLTDENFFYLFDEDRGAYEVQESDYTIQNSQGPVLTFATYSLLSKLADPELFNNGSGWQGDNEFVLMGHSADKDTVYLKSVRAQKRCFLVKNTEEWEPYFEKLNTVIRNFENANARNNYFRDVLVFDKDTAVMTGFNMTSRMAFLYQYENDTLQVDSCLFHFTPDKVLLKRPVHLGNTEVTHFSFSEDNSSFMVNDEANSVVRISQNGRPLVNFNVRDKVLRGYYKEMQDGIEVERSDMYFINLNPQSADDEWDKLFESLENYMYMLLLPDDSVSVESKENVYYLCLYDQLLDDKGQSHPVLGQCEVNYMWTPNVDDEITFRGVKYHQNWGGEIIFAGSDSDDGSLYAGTPLADKFEEKVKAPYTSYVKSLFGSGSSRDAVNCIIVPSPDEQEFYFVNKKNGEYLGIMKVY